MVLYERPMLPTRYPDPNCLEALGIEAIMKYLCNQLQWDKYSDTINVTYRHLPLEFLSSLIYEPYIGRGINPSKEFIFLQATLYRRRLNPMPFMIAHMGVVEKKGDTVSFGGLITSITHALGLDTELATLEPIPPCTVNLIFLEI